MTAQSWPVGRRGQALAVSVAVTALVIIWLVIVGPLNSFYRDQEDALDQRYALLLRMQSLAGTLAPLRAASANRLGEAPEADQIMLPGATDAVAAADLQERLQRMANIAGVNLTAVETLPVEAAATADTETVSEMARRPTTGGWHKVSLRISLNASWQVLIALMQSIEQEPTRIFIDDVHFHSPVVVAHQNALPIQASMVLYGFRPAEPGAGA